MFDFDAIVEAINTGNNSYFARVCPKFTKAWHGTNRVSRLLFAAVQAGNHEAIRILAKSGADIKVLGDKGDSLLHKAVYAGHAAASSAQAEAPGHIEVIKTLIAFGVDLDGGNDDLKTPLHLCCSVGWVDGIDVLVKSGASMSALDLNSRSAMMIAAAESTDIENSGHVIDMLIKSGADRDFEAFTTGDTPVKLAIEKHNPYALNVMLDSGMKLSHTGRNKQSVLQYATQCGAVKVIELLDSRDYDMNEVDESGNNAIHRLFNVSTGALSRGRLRALIMAGVNTHTKNKDGKSGVDLVYENKGIVGLTEAYEIATRDRIAKILDETFEPDVSRTRNIKI